VLAKYHPLDTLDDYVSSEKVALIKLHGSVNWGRARLHRCRAAGDRRLPAGLPPACQEP
jgi:hypothetical protein